MTKKKIINFIRDNWAVIGFLISFILDSQYGILEKLLNNDVFWINIVKGLGVLVVGYFTKDKLGTTKTKRNVYLDGEYTAEQQDAVNECVVILDAVGLELVGTRPKDR